VLIFLETALMETTSNVSSTPKRRRRALSPIRTRSKSRRLQKENFEETF